MKTFRIYQFAIVDCVNKGGVFSAHLEDEPSHEVSLRLCGKMQMASITISAGDRVSVELSPYDLHRGRVLWRD